MSVKPSKRIRYQYAIQSYNHRAQRSRDGLPLIGRDQMSLLKALVRAPRNQLSSLREWYASKGVTGGSRESRRQSCWGLINAGWVIAQKRKAWEVKLTPEGKEIALGKVRVKVINRREKQHILPPTISADLRMLFQKFGLDKKNLYRRRN